MSSSRRNGSVSRAAEVSSKNRLHMDRNPQHSRITDPSNPAGRRKEIDNVMKRARQGSPGTWDRKLLEVEEKDPNRWRHTGYKQMYIDGSPRRSGSRSPLGRRSRSPMGRRSRSPMGRRSRSPMGRRSPPPRRSPPSPAHPRRPRTPPPARSTLNRRTPPAARRRSPRPRSPPPRPRSPAGRRAPSPPAPRRQPRARPPSPRRRPPSPPPKSASSGSSASSCSDESCSVCSAKNKKPPQPPPQKPKPSGAAVPSGSKRPPAPPAPPAGRAVVQPTRELLKAREASKRSREEKVLEWQRTQLAVGGANPPAAPIPPAMIKREGERRPPPPVPPPGVKAPARKRPDTGVSPAAVAAALADSGTDSESDESSEPPQRLTLSERFGKMAQWSQDRSSRLENMRITRRDQGLHVHIERSDRSASPRAQYGAAEPEEIGSYPEELLAAAPGGLPLWDDVRVRYEYYKKRGYLRGLTLSDYVKWEEWWYKYQEWLKRERAYERWAEEEGSVRRERRRRGGRHRRS